MKIGYLYEAVFGSYKNTKVSGKDIATKIAADAIFEKYKGEIMEVYVSDIKELMDSTVDSPFSGSTEKYRVCNRYVKDISPDAYGIGARISRMGTNVIIEQMVSFQTSFTTGSKSFYICQEEMEFWEKEEEKLHELFPKYTFKIMLDWIYVKDGTLHPRTEVNSDVDQLPRYQFPYPINEANCSGTISLGYEVSLEMFVKYWNRFINRSDHINTLYLENPSMTNLDLSVPSDFKVNRIMIRGGASLTNLEGAKKYLMEDHTITYNLNGFRDFLAHRNDGTEISTEYASGTPAYEIATNGALSLENLKYLFDNSPNGSLLFSYFIYDLDSKRCRLFDSSYSVDKVKITEWFKKENFKKVVNKYLKRNKK